MIRITCKNETSATRLFLEGKLAGNSVDELDKCWQNSSAIPTTFLVDLTNITFIDDHGKELLMKMHRHGAQLVSRSLMTKCLIKEIKQAVRRN
jgi:ABC-type transporter Mla MlaB component